MSVFTRAAPGGRPRLRTVLYDDGKSPLEERLERLPRPSVAVFAAREALRAAPLVASAPRGAAEQLGAVGFRAILTAYTAIYAPEARSAALEASDAAFAAASLDEAASAALYAAARAGTAATALSAPEAAYAGFAAAYSSGRAAACDGMILAEAAEDLARLEADGSADGVRASPLWPRGAPADFDIALARLGEALEAAGLRSAAWFAWYRSKIGGWPTLLAAERDCVLSGDGAAAPAL